MKIKRLAVVLGALAYLTNLSFASSYNLYANLSAKSKVVKIINTYNQHGCILSTPIKMVGGQNTLTTLQVIWAG